MTERQRLVLDRFQLGYNCAQSVFSVFSEEYGIDVETANRLTASMGSGFRCGSLCGALAGAVMVVGLKYGAPHDAPTEQHAVCRLKTEEFMTVCGAHFPSTQCRELIGDDPAQRGKMRQTVCERLVLSAVTLLEELGY